MRSMAQVSEQITQARRGGRWPAAGTRADPATAISRSFVIITKE